MTVQERVEIWTGGIWDPRPVYQILQDSVRQVLNEIDPDALNQLWTELTDSGSGVDLTNYRMIEARKALRVATFISPSWRSNTNITASNPAVYSLGGLTYVIPSGGTILAHSYPTVKLSDTSVTGVPDQLLYVISLHTAMGYIQHEMGRLTSEVTTDVTLPTAPATPSTPSISYVDAAAVAPSAVNVAALPTAPSYSAPSLAARPSTPVVGTLNLALKVDGVTALTAPTAPSAPSIAYVDAVAASAVASTLAALGTAPTVTKPTFGGNIASITSAIPASLDLTTEIDGLTALAVPTAPAAPSLSSAGQSTVSVTMTAVDAAAPTYTKPSATENLDFTSWSSAYTDHDVHLLAEGMRKAAVELDEIKAHIEEENGEFSKEVEIYRAKLQKAIMDAQIAAKEAENELIQTDRMALEDYIQELQRYDRQIAEYEANVTVQIRQFEANVSRAIRGLAEAQRLYLEQYRIDLEAERLEFQKELAVYQTDAQHKIEQVRVTLQEALQDARTSTDVSIQNEAQTLAAAIQDYSLELGLFERKIQLYGMEVDAVVKQYIHQLDRAIQVFEIELRGDTDRYQAQVANARAAFEGELELFRGGVARNALAAEIARAEAQQTAAQSTDVAVQNEAKTLDAAIATQQLIMAKFEADVALYANQVRAVLEQQKSEEETRERKLNMMARQRDRVAKKYEEARISYETQYRRHRPINVRHVSF